VHSQLGWQPDIARRAFDVIAVAQRARTLRELDAAASTALKAFGFEVVIAVEIKHDRGVQGIEPLFGDVDAPSIRHYVSSGFAANCPVISAASAEPCSWSELKDGSLTVAQRRVFDELGEFAMHEGHVMAVHRRGRRPLAVSLAGDQVALSGPDERAAVQVLSTFYGLIGSQLTDAAYRPVRLSPRQIECLSWVRDGKSSADIGDLLAISARTVDDHLLAACDRLGVKTRVQAVIEAAVRGLLTL
jgi:LuxR family quorum-sensing system transcriptional regulator CciR